MGLGMEVDTVNVAVGVWLGDVGVRASGAYAPARSTAPSTPAAIKACKILRTILKRNTKVHRGDVGLNQAAGESTLRR